MNKTKATSTALALAVALPNIITPVMAAPGQGVNTLAAPQKSVVLAQTKKTTKKASPAQLKSMLNKELAEMTPAQKRQIGADRINKLAVMSGDQIARGGCFTQGVGCQGTSGFTSGVLCCLIAKTGI